MSNRKNKKQRIQAEQKKINNSNPQINDRKSQIKELKILKEKAIKLEKEIVTQKKENKKQLRIRNLKIFANTCNFAAPFVISAGLTVGAFKLFGGGYPFHIDEITKYKEYKLDYKTNGYVMMDESYREEERVSSNELIIYTPWEYKEGKYIRYKREYNIGELSSLDLFDIVLEEDYSYIKENLKDYKEERQEASNISEINGQDYFFEANIHFMDKSNILTHDETKLKNTVITVIECIIGGLIGTIATAMRNYSYLCRIRQNNLDYHCNIVAIKPMEEELELTNNKILLLSKKEGITNEK